MLVVIIIITVLFSALSVLSAMMVRSEIVHSAHVGVDALHNAVILQMSDGLQPVITHAVFSAVWQPFPRNDISSRRGCRGEMARKQAGQFSLSAQLVPDRIAGDWRAQPACGMQCIAAILLPRQPFVCAAVLLSTSTRLVDRERIPRQSSRSVGYDSEIVSLLRLQKNAGGADNPLINIHTRTSSHHLVLN